jgi:hypothetical protein
MDWTIYCGSAYVAEQSGHPGAQQQLSRDLQEGFHFRLQSAVRFAELVRHNICI